MSKRVALFLALSLFCGLAPLSAQKGFFSVYKMPDSMPGEMYILVDKGGTFTASYSYQPDAEDEDSTCVGVIEGKVGKLTLQGEYREVNKGQSLWGRMELVFDTEDKSCFVAWQDDAFDEQGVWTLEFLKEGGEYDTMKMDLYKGLLNAYYDREETEEYLELWN